MSTVRIAKRYAEAVLDAIPGGMAADDLILELVDVRSSIRQSRELQLLFESPIIPGKKKTEAVKALFTGKVSAYTLSVLTLLIEKRREEVVVDIIDAVIELRRVRAGILATTVHSAVELSEQDRTTLQKALASVSGKRIDAQYRVDSELVGGVTVRLGDTVYDGSVRHQLKRLRDRFVSGR